MKAASKANHRRQQRRVDGLGWVCCLTNRQVEKVMRRMLAENKEFERRCYQAIELELIPQGGRGAGRRERLRAGARAFQDLQSHGFGY